MKQQLLFIIFQLGLFIGTGYAQSCSDLPIFQQGKHFVFLQQTTVGAIFEHTGTNSKQLPTQIIQKRNTYSIKSVKNEGSTLIATIDITTDTSKKAPFGNVFTGILCNGHTVSYVLTSKVPGMSFSFTIDFPLDMKVGDELKDEVINMNMGKATKSTYSGITRIVHRQVVGNEMVTTPAGTWKCFKISEIGATQLPAENGRPTTTINDPAPSYSWFAPNMGIIKMQTQSMSSTTTLIAFH